MFTQNSTFGLRRRVLVLALLGLGAALPSWAQPGTYPRNGVYDQRPGLYAFTHATIQTDYQTRLTDATLLVREGKVVQVGPTASVKIPAGAVVQDLTGQYIYPGLVDIFTSYGVPEVKAPERRGRRDAEHAERHSGRGPAGHAERTDARLPALHAEDLMGPPQGGHHQAPLRAAQPADLPAVGAGGVSKPHLRFPRYVTVFPVRKPEFA